MAGKRKNPSDQPELPIEGVAPAAPAAEKAGNGAEHVLAGEVEASARGPFVPGKIELALHRRVDRSFLDYASYVIRDRAIPHLIDGLKPVQRRILWTLHQKDDGRFIKVATVAGAACRSARLACRQRLCRAGAGFLRHRHAGGRSRRFR